MTKQRYYPLRDADHPYCVTRIPITEEQYQGLMPEIHYIPLRDAAAALGADEEGGNKYVYVSR